MYGRQLEALLGDAGERTLGAKRSSSFMNDLKESGLHRRVDSKIERICLA